MTTYDLVIQNLSSPPVLAFFIGIFAYLVKSDLKIPQQISEAVSIYLLLAIGIKGGEALSKTSFDVIITPLFITIIMGLITPIIAYVVARRLVKLNIENSAALAAHYGSVSAVTFMACLNFLDAKGESYERFMPALLAVLEIPAIIFALSIASMARGRNSSSLSKALHESLTGKSVVLLIGGIIIGAASGETNVARIAPFFKSPFFGVLTFFLLEMGILASSRLRELQGHVIVLLLYGIAIPVAFSFIGILAGVLSGLSPGGVAVMATMAASASYIAAPAAVKIALPEANPGIYLTASISITLPFNIIAGIPMYYLLAERFASVQ